MKRIFLLTLTLASGCCVQPYQRLYILADEGKLERDTEITTCALPEPSSRRSSEALPAALPIIP